MTSASESRRSNSSKRGARSPSFGQEIIRRLRQFSEVLEKGEDLSKHFKVTTYDLDLPAVPYDAKKVKALREKLRASQPAFAQFIGVTIGTLRAWEQGAKSPNPIACRFMAEMERNPDYWIKRLQESLVRERQRA